MTNYRMGQPIIASLEDLDQASAFVSGLAARAGISPRVGVVLGSGLGAFFGFYCYIAFFKKLESRTAFLLRNMNYIIGTITALVSVITICNIINYYL